jgi:hypothetical protein
MLAFVQSHVNMNSVKAIMLASVESYVNTVQTHST